MGQYKTENAILEKSGLMDDPSYIKGLKDSTFINAHENVFVFSSHLASMEVLQMLSLIISPSGVADVGQQLNHFVTGTMDSDTLKKCDNNCYFLTVLGRGDNSGIQVFGEHIVAEVSRKNRLK